jgi:purine-binding chemotaxis protein CheW
MEPTETPEHSRPDSQSVIFRLDAENYGIDIFRVSEIIRMREITPIPRSENYVRGLVNLRGKTIPVVDLRVRLCLETKEETENSRIIVVESDHGQVGMIVDAVSEVATLAADSIEDAPDLASDVSAEFVSGIAKRSGNLVTLLDLDKTLAA